MQMKNRTGVLLSLGALLLLAGTAGAQTLGTSARQLTKGSLKLLAYYQGTQDQVLNFNVVGGGSCASGNNISFACSQSGDVEAKGSGGQGLLKVVYQPWESLQYYAVWGAGDYTLRVPSTTLVNTLKGDTAGMTYGAGVKAVLMADTQFSPAIAADLSLMYSRYKFNRRTPSAGVVSAPIMINQALGLTQYQVAIEASHIFTLIDAQDKNEAKDAGLTLVQTGVKLEPYGGVKWTRIQADLHDLQDGSHSGGMQDTISPFVGLRVPAFAHETFFAEASFVNGTQYAGGLEVRF
jgi:hypothetical protein